MSSFTLIMFLVGVLGFAVSLVCLLVNLVKKKNPKKVVKIFGGFIALMILSIVLKPSVPYERAEKITTDGTVEVSTPVVELTPEQIADNKKNDDAQAIENKKSSAATAPETKKYSDGKYLVNKDIESGLYRVTLTDSIMRMGYVERAKDLNMELDSILANILLTGDGYIEILSTDVAVKLQGVEIEPIKIKDLKPSIKKEATDGIYLVGYDLAVGTYKVEVTDTTTKMGYVERSKSVAMNSDDIIANEIIQGPGYVKIQKGDFAVRLQGVKITFQK